MMITKITAAAGGAGVVIAGFSLGKWVDEVRAWGTEVFYMLSSLMQ